MDAPPPQSKALFQFKLAPVEPPKPKPEPHSACNLLRGVFRKSWQETPSVAKLQLNHGECLVKTSLGHDFALITADGVEFKVHRTMILGRSKMLQDSIFHGDAPNPTLFIDLQATFYPIFVDRLITFLYIGSYSAGEKETLRILHNATHIPEPSTEESYNRTDLNASAFHLHMCALAEQLEYPALYDHAYNEIRHLLLQTNMPPRAVKDLIDFADADPATRVIKDVYGWIQNLVVAGAVIQETKHWNWGHRDMFRTSMDADEYEAFWNMHAEIKAASLDVLPPPKEEKGQKKGREKKMKKERTQRASQAQRWEVDGWNALSNSRIDECGATAGGRVEKCRNRLKKDRRQRLSEMKDQERRTAAVLKGLENMGLD
ncbi:hypothetical protein CC86DRAFT_340312 [Ophiobolus disseminans]|uniref:BTB domain-containing protein n=1 Tax=Ophiobolus disseminans TaxID=1469910 RepID=A0A6A7AFR8_9PLEO|nr:hypothetical protein CC86DRAFT_340312 [Ophiobolus disseminans]